jgi:TolB protein
MQGCNMSLTSVAIKPVVRVCLILISAWLSTYAKAELVVEITQGRASAIPISVVPFVWETKDQEAEDIAAIIRSNLKRSGHFNTLLPTEMLSFPKTENDIFYRDWRLLKQDYMVLGNIKFDKDKAEYVAQFELYDVFQKKRLMAHEARGDSSQLRAIAHYISDRLYERLTGIPGAFSTKIAYVSTTKERKSFRLEIADADGYNAKVILQSKDSIISPAWSPDGKQIAYVSFENDRSQIFMHDLATGKRRVIASFKGINSSPRFSPDGRYLAATLSKDGNAEIYVLDLGTGSWRRMTKHYGIDTEASWTADGKKILFTSSRSGKPQIYQVELATGDVERLTFEGNYNARAQMTHDGKYLILVHQPERGGDFYIASLDLRRKSTQILTSDTALDESPCISPNGSMILYAANYRGRTILAAVSVDGQVRHLLPAKYGEVREPSWGPILH